MGKYIKNSKAEAGVAVVDMNLGVRTRAKALALQRPPYHLRSRSHLRPSTSTQSPKPGANPSSSSNPNRCPQQPHTICKSNRNSYRCSVNNDKVVRSAVVAEDSPAVWRAENVRRLVKPKEAERKGNVGDEAGVGGDCTETRVEPSLGENSVDSNSIGRSVRESTPSNSVRDPETMQFLGSTTEIAHVAETFWRRHKQRCAPSSREMDDFFDVAEKEQVRDFINKYNFDPVTEKPLPGRYEWVQLDPPGS